MTATNRIVRAQGETARPDQALALPPSPPHLWNIDALMVDIVEALLAFGGSAHRDMVIERIARQRSEISVSDPLRQEVIAALARHRRAAQAAGRAPLVHLPFGIGSRRWELTENFSTFLAQSPPPTDRSVRK